MKTRQERFLQALRLLPQHLRGSLYDLSPEQQAQAEEIRLRQGQPPGIVSPWGEYAPSADAVSSEDLQCIFRQATQYSAYTAQESLAQGFVTAEGGFRIGLCGTAVLQNGAPVQMRQFSSMALRIPHEEPGIARELTAEMLEQESFCSTLILSPPGGGKTTFLRDAIRCLSDGMTPRRVVVVDEREEIAAQREGVFQMQVGCHTDVLSACPKAVAIPLLLRTMNPEILAVDEITVPEDIEAVASAANCGVGLLATIHAASVEELRRKPLYQMLLAQKVFRKAVVIRRMQGRREYGMESLTE